MVALTGGFYRLKNGIYGGLIGVAGVITVLNFSFHS